jgi:hypothetical protein
MLSGRGSLSDSVICCDRRRVDEAVGSIRSWVLLSMAKTGSVVTDTMQAVVSNSFDVRKNFSICLFLCLFDQLRS